MLHLKKKKTEAPRPNGLWERSLALHGRPCRDLAIGVRVCETALERLDLDPETCRERLVCVSESDGCAVDAIQAGLGCTMGKKHLLFFLCSYSGTILAVMMTGKIVTSVCAIAVLFGYLPTCWMILLAYVSNFLNTSMRLQALFDWHWRKRHK